MSKDARTFMKDRIREIAQEKTTVTIRLKPQYYLMLKELSNLYKFPISSSFDDMISEHLMDIMISLEDDDFDSLAESIDDTRFSVWRRLEDEGLTRPQLFNIPGLCPIEQHKDL